MGRSELLIIELRVIGVVSQQKEENRGIQADNKRREMAKIRTEKEVKEGQGKGIQAHDMNR